MLRRQFLGSAALAAAQPSPSSQASSQAAPRPNILWITCEDMSPNLGCYGDRYATSPNLDRFAARSLRYLAAWSNAPVCAPARTTIITGMYPPSTGSEHMRSWTRLAPGRQMFPVYLREAGYYCTNNVKEDYNVEHTGKVWDESSNKAHWRNRKPGQPFFAVFNFTITHESQIRTRPHQQVHDPAGVRVPAYHPDTPEVRQDWAQYYDNITTMDQLAGRVLGELEQDGLTGDTIVFFYSDHGSGMPRSKRWPFNSGLHVPLLVHFPEKYRHLAPKDYQPGGTTGRLVSFVDLAPAALSLAGLKKPAYYQGHAFLGAHAAPEQPYIYGFRGRMDERYDMVRSVRDGRYVYLRHYMPHRIYGEHVAYMFETPTTRKWAELYREGKLNAVQRRFWETKPPEELFDLESDPDETKNLAGSPEHRGILEQMRQAQLDLAIRVADCGYLAEAEMEARQKAGTPYHPAKVVAAADTATRTANPAWLRRMLRDADSGVRYWAVTGMLFREMAAPAQALEDASPSVRVVAAESIVRYGADADARAALETLLGLADVSRHGYALALAALNAIDHVGPRLNPYLDRVRALPRTHAAIHQRMQDNIRRLIEHILGEPSRPSQA